MHAHNRLCSKMAKDTNICTRVKGDPPTLQSTQACDPHTATLCSSPPSTHLGVPHSLSLCDSWSWRENQATAWLGEGVRDRVRGGLGAKGWL